jgi:chromosome segregation ATPase
MSEINFKGELKKGYLMFRAFEHGMKLAEEIDNLEGAIQAKNKELAEINASIKSSKALRDKEIDKIADEIEQLRKAELDSIETIKKSNEEIKIGLDKRIYSLNQAVKKAEEKIAEKNKALTELDIQIAQREKDLNLFNKEIEETKTKFRSMF